MRAKKIILLVGIVLMGSTLWAQRPGIKPIKKLTYSAYYNLVFNISAGTIDITITPSDKYPNCQKLLAVGRTNPNRDWIFKIRDTLYTYHDKDTYKSYEFSRKAHEGKYHKTFDYIFDYDKEKIYSTVHRIDRYLRHDTLPLQPSTYDMLSMAWIARELDYSQYEENSLIPIRVLIDDKTYDLYVRYLGIEKLKTKKGKRDCIVFTPLLVEGDVFKGGEGMKIWVSNDEYRLPLMIEAKILVGSIRAVLEE